jgi:plasmid stabilization system protein ParE
MSLMRVRVVPTARAQIAACNRWWRANRTQNPTLFRQELTEATTRLEASPSVGPRYEEAELPGVRRLLLPRTQYHLYDVVQESARTILVLAIRHAARDSGPGL